MASKETLKRKAEKLNKRTKTAKEIAMIYGDFRRNTAEEPPRHLKKFDIAAGRVFQKIATGVAIKSAAKAKKIQDKISHTA